MERPWVKSPAYAIAIRLLVEARTEAGWTQRALAERLGKSRSFVSKSESLERRLDFVEFIAFARAIGVEPGTLMAKIANELPEGLGI